jgi:succinate-semialdehyde dehydrogenase/glutarate-semialdehyde dehydrogenase
MDTMTRTITSVNPSTLEPLGEVPVATPDDVRDAMARARSAQRGWGARTPADRARVMRRAAQITAAHAEELARAASLEGGKTLFESYVAEVMPTAETFRWLAKYAPRHLAAERLRHATPLFKVKRSWLHFEPLGIVGIIAPWNYPLSIPATEVAFALACGNGVVLKPSEHTPLIAERLRDLLTEAGVPRDLVQVVHGYGDTGAAVVEAGPDKVLFTGSVPTGRRVAAMAGERGIPVTLELGGKDAMYVRADADIQRAVDGAAFGAFFNAGQTCCSVERLYVHRDVAEEFVDRLARKANALRVGDPLEPTTDVGPMIHAGQRRIVEEHVADAEARGARRLSGGVIEAGLPGAFFAPAVVVDVPDDARLMREETFGPVVPIRVVSGDDEAVRLANDCEFGLTASVWTRDVDAGTAIAQRIEAGTVFVNDVLYAYASPDAPWGGVKSSGSGRTHSRYGLYELVSVKHVSVDPGWLPAIGYPYSLDLLNAVRNGLQSIYAKGADRVGAVWQAASSARRALRP